MFRCPLQPPVLLLDRLRVSSVPAGGKFGVCVVCPLANVDAAPGVHELLLGRRELLLGGRELLLLLVLVEEVVVVGASPILYAISVGIELVFLLLRLILPVFY